MTLYHYTSGEHINEIIYTGVLQPNPKVLANGGPPLVWLTDMTTPDADALGLPGVNRTRHRLVIDPLVETAWWPSVRRIFAADPLWDTYAHFWGIGTGHQDRWWVALGPVPIQPVRRRLSMPVAHASR